MLHDKESEFWCYLAGGKNARCSIVYIRIRFPCPATVLINSSLKIVTEGEIVLPIGRDDSPVYFVLYASALPSKIIEIESEVARQTV